MRLVVEDLVCQRSGRPVFSGVSFAVDGGEALVLDGRNGAGKSSLLLILAGLLARLRPILAGEGHDDRTLGEQAHYVGHRDALKPSLTPLETLAFWRPCSASPP